jgi:DNA-directed RNA polymerase specialized sigma24 family protein
MKKKRIIGLDWLNIVAKQHDEWVSIVRGFGEYNYAEDIVHESYLRLIKYATPQNIIKDNKVSRGYMFFTLRSVYFQYYHSKRKITKISLDDPKWNIEIQAEETIEEQEAFHSVCVLIDEVTEDWAWYDRKLFKLYRDTGLSIRKIAAETNISWVSIFNTLKNCKKEVRDKLNEDYLDYKNEDYERVSRRQKN